MSVAVEHGQPYTTATALSAASRNTVGFCSTPKTTSSWDCLVLSMTNLAIRQRPMELMNAIVGDIGVANVQAPKLG